MNRWANLGRILISPSAVGRDVMQDPHWVIPLVIVLAISLIAAVTTYQYQVKLQREYVGEMIKERNPDADLDSMFRVTPARQVLSGVLAVVVAGIVLLVFSAVLKGVASVAGGSIPFRQMFSFTCYTSVIGVLGAVVKIPLVLMKGTIDVRTSLAAFAPSLSMRSPLAVLLGSFDIFTICQLVAVCFGYSVLSGFSIKKSSGIVVGLWAILVVIRIVLAMLPGLAGASR
jgi:hypothetical protein